MDSDVINDAKPAEYFANPPYRAELFRNNIAGVMNKNNINCLTFKINSGAVLTSFELATAIAEKWNNEN